MSPLLKRFIFPTVSVVNKEDQKYVIYNFKLVTYGLYFKFWNKHSDVYVKYAIEVYGTVYYLHIAEILLQIKVEFLFCAMLTIRTINFSMLSESKHQMDITISHFSF